MKILHLDTGREMRGGQWQVLRLHQALLEAGHESFLLARRGSPLLAAAVVRGLPCHPLTPLFRSRDFDIVHAHDARSHTLAALFSRVPVVVSRRVAFPVRKSLGSRWKYARPRRYLAVSNYVAGMLVDAGISPDRIDAVYDGVEIPHAAAEGDAIITPYTDDPAKGMALAKEAARLAELPLVCSKDLTRDLPTALAMIYITQSEGLGSGILLAMAYGVAVIASNTGGIPELIEHGVTGFLVPNDPGAVVDVLATVNRQIGRAAREHVRARFTVAHMLRATLNSYERAIHD